MEITNKHIALIRQDILEKGVKINDLTESLIDHICCSIENSCETDFKKAYSNALEIFGKNEFYIIQQETIYLLNLKRQIIMKKLMFTLGYVAVILCTTSILFKLQHWPGASVMLTIGIFLLNFGFLPMYFFDRYKRAIG